MDRDELKATFHRVNAYRQVCEAVRRTAGHTLFSGCFFVFIAVIISNAVGFDHPIFLFYAGLAALEIGVGLWKRFRPSVECVLVDALLNLAFGASLIVRYAMGIRTSYFSLFIGAWALFDAWRSFTAYLQLRKAFEVRPTRAQMNYVAEMARDIRDADPNSDPTAFDLPSDPPVQVLLVDDLAFLADPESGDAIAVDRDDVTLTRHVSPDGRETLGALRIQRSMFPPAPLSDANWRNYLRWKGESEGSLTRLFAIVSPLEYASYADCSTFLALP